jgi:hypothetical protein
MLVGQPFGLVRRRGPSQVPLPPAGAENLDRRGVILDSKADLMFVHVSAVTGVEYVQDQFTLGKRNRPEKLTEDIRCIVTGSHHLNPLMAGLFLWIDHGINNQVLVLIDGRKQLAIPWEVEIELVDNFANGYFLVPYNATHIVYPFKTSQ